MEQAILANKQNPAQLEALYRKDKAGFKKAFNHVYPNLKEEAQMQFWNARLNFEEEKFGFGSNQEFIVVALLALVAGLFANISNMPGINVELFFSRNISFLIMPFITLYYVWKQGLSTKTKWGILLILLILATYINLIPNNPNSSSILLVYIHIPLLLWSVMGYGYLGNSFSSTGKRIQFLKYNGDLLIMTAVMLLSGMLFTVITFGLFNLIGIKIEEFYMKHIAIWGIGAIPLFATYLVDNNPQIINKVSPIIAKIFTPLVFINLLVYLITLVYTGKYPHQDRNLLLVYNALLVGVLALIFFSIAEAGKAHYRFFNTLLLFGLSTLTIVVNGIALSAIVFRIAEWGFTPNRITVLGGNILICVNLILVTIELWKAIRNKANFESVENTIAKFLPVYAVWTAIVAFVLPIVFHWS
ncbi:MAG: hypothetical protein RLZ56_1158 [Bacteroidota bacterium]|jgi:hypothetical protein